MDYRFEKHKDAVKVYVPMCENCGMCCLDKDWSTDFEGELVGICRNYDMKCSCIDESKKSLHCRTFACKSFEQFAARFYYIRGRQCTTVNRKLAELMIRKEKDFTIEEKEILYRKEIKCPEQK